MELPILLMVVVAEQKALREICSRVLTVAPAAVVLAALYAAVIVILVGTQFQLVM